MNWKKFAAALAVAFLAATAFDILLNGVLMREAFALSAPYWRPPDELYKLIPLGWLAMLLSMSFTGVVFTRTGWIGIRRGLEFGLWLGLAAVVGVLGMATLVPWPMKLLVAMAVQQFGNSLILGLLFGWKYK
ncbi:MAG: hypothetical protein ONB46_26180 [candidate division KSB1 bacterium]|nr:hypothetical protein [candidate division KSB1 bacterium]MDZ7369420.1 hypothetical protein [candidate division KSB1 bacterium]MDZ7407503.1 hypothetical protein [candidate division KSB1 bacterium]